MVCHKGVQELSHTADDSQAAKRGEADPLEGTRPVPHSSARGETRYRNQTARFDRSFAAPRGSVHKQSIAIPAFASAHPVIGIKKSSGAGFVQSPHAAVSCE